MTFVDKLVDSPACKGYIASRILDTIGIVLSSIICDSFSVICPVNHDKLFADNQPELILLIRFANILQRGDKVIQYLRRHHDAVSVGTYLLRNAYHSSSCIAFQVNEEGLAIRYNLFRTNNIVVHFFRTGLVI